MRYPFDMLIFQVKIAAIKQASIGWVVSTGTNYQLIADRHELNNKYYKPQVI